MNFIQSILGLVTRKKFLSNVDDKDVMLIARDNARIGSSQPKLEAKAVELKKIKDYISGGAVDKRGYEPFERDSLIYPRQINGGLPFDDLTRYGANTTLSTGANNACPFWVQQKVNITRFRVSSGTGNVALCLYKYTSQTPTSGLFFLMDFTLVSQSPVFNMPISGAQFQTLSTPLTVEPGSVYVAVLLPVSGTTIGVNGVSSRGIINGIVKTAQTNSFLGSANNHFTKFSGVQLSSSPAAVITDGIAPSTLRFVTQQPEASMVDYLQIGVINV